MLITESVIKFYQDYVGVISYNGDNLFFLIIIEK